MLSGQINSAMRASIQVMREQQRYNSSAKLDKDKHIRVNEYYFSAQSSNNCCLVELKSIDFTGVYRAPKPYRKCALITLECRGQCAD